MARKHSLLLFLLPVFFAGCTFSNQRLNAPEIPVESRMLNHTRADVGADIAPTLASPTTPGVLPTTVPNAHASPTTNDGFFVGLALSGGGSRSANFAASCMFELQRLDLLKHVGYVSSVSGGSLVSAYFCCSGDGSGGWNPAEVQRRLTHSFASDMIVAILEPWNTIAMALTSKSRSDLLAQTLRDHLFTRDGHEMTFADFAPTAHVCSSTPPTCNLAAALFSAIRASISSTATWGNFRSPTPSPPVHPSLSFCTR